jgi:hypothetical protein
MTTNQPGQSTAPSPPARGPDAEQAEHLRPAVPLDSEGHPFPAAPVPHPATKSAEAAGAAKPTATAGSAEPGETAEAGEPVRSVTPETTAGDAKSAEDAKPAGDAKPGAKPADNAEAAGDAKPAVAAAAAAVKPGRRRFLLFGRRKAAAVAAAVAPEEAPQETEKAVRLKEPLPSDRPEGVPQDPWKAFATTRERGPGWFRRATRAVLRSLIHEYALVVYAAVALAVAMTWPTLRYPLHTLPQDLGDPAHQAWQVAWAGHILITDPVRLWQSPAYFPMPNSFAFGDSLLGYAPAGMLGEGPLAATLRYNILFVLAHALLLIGAYALVRQLGAGRTGAAVAAVAFAYAPWRLAQEGHLDIISAGGIPLALAMLARGHGWSLRHGFRRRRRHAGWAALGWLVAAWQVTLGLSLGLPFLGVLGLIVLVLLVRVPIRWLRRPAERPVLGWRLHVTDLLGILIVAGVAALIAIPYFRTSGTANAAAEIKFFSPPLRSLLIAPAESRIWGAPHAVPRSSLAWPSEMSLLPGFMLYALALAGLAFSIWTLWQRLFLLAGLAVTIILTLGSNFFDGRWTYLPLFGHLPASLDLRIPGRLMLWVTLLLGILAAGAVAEFVRRAENVAAQRIPPWPGPWLRLATLVPLLLVLAEGWNATAHPVVPAQPAAMRTVTGQMLVLPTGELTDETVLLWSTTRFQKLANGSGGFAATRQAELRRAAATFPDAASIQYLRSQNITIVLLLRSQVAGTPWERSGDIPVDTLGIQREDLDDAVLFRLS